MADPSPKGALILVAIVAVLIAVVVILNLGERNVPDVGAEGLPSMGSGDVEVFLFEDYQCPHCRDYELSSTKQDLVTRWVAPGHVTIVYKFVAFLGDDSWDAARASQCVYENSPDDWPEWNRLMYQAQRGTESGWASAESVHTRTSSWGGVDMDDYRDCLRDRDRLDAIIEQNSDDMGAAGIRGTPGLLIGDQTPDPGDTAAVNAAIESAMAAKDSGDGSNGSTSADGTTTGTAVAPHGRS